MTIYVHYYIVCVCDYIGRMCTRTKTQSSINWRAWHIFNHHPKHMAIICYISTTKIMSSRIYDYKKTKTRDVLIINNRTYYIIKKNHEYDKIRYKRKKIK